MLGNKHISIVVPVRKGSQRVKSKNTKPFSRDGKSLIQLKVEQLLKIKNVDEIVITTDDAIAI
jgi:CMP-N-acetylneuraminic acid synthetase